MARDLGAESRFARQVSQPLSTDVTDGGCTRFLAPILGLLFAVSGFAQTVHVQLGGADAASGPLAVGVRHHCVGPGVLP